MDVANTKAAVLRDFLTFLDRDIPANTQLGLSAGRPAVPGFLTVFPDSSVVAHEAGVRVGTPADPFPADRTGGDCDERWNIKF